MIKSEVRLYSDKYEKIFFTTDSESKNTCIYRVSDSKLILTTILPEYVVSHESLAEFLENSLIINELNTIEMEREKKLKQEKEERKQQYKKLDENLDRKERYLEYITRQLTELISSMNKLVSMKENESCLKE